MAVSQAFRPGHHGFAGAIHGNSGCWIGSEGAGNTLAKVVLTTSRLQSSRAHLRVPSSSAKDPASTTVVVLYSLCSSDVALLTSNRRRNIHKKAGDYGVARKRGFVRSCGKKSNSETSEPSSIEEGQAVDPTVIMSSTSGSGRPEKLSFFERVKTNPLLGFFEGASNALRGDELGVEIAVIALPALLALAADPLASLVDTGFIGQIGPVELAAVGVSISVFNLTSKMFNLPLLNVTTSFVAEEEASAKDAQLDSLVMEQMVDRAASPEGGADDPREELLQSMDIYAPRNTKPLLPAVSSALVLATALGVMEGAVMSLGAGPILTVMGVGVGSEMRVPALQYLALRAIGAPAVVIALAVQGVFRGFKDTKTPLYATVAGNVVNIVLDPILMFALKFGVSGAAVATVISQYVIALMLMWILNQRVTLLPPRLGDLKFDKFWKSGGLLLGRTVALILTFTLSTSMAARQGAIPMAAYQVCMGVWLAASLLSDSLALAGQAIIASAFAKGDYRMVKEASFRVLQIGLAMGLLMGTVLAVNAGWFTQLFTKDAGVLEAMALIIPFVVFTQPINSLAFVFDGIHYGVSDFGYAAFSMVIIAFLSCIVLLLAAPTYGLPGVWIGLTTIMTLRMAAGFLRIGSCTGPWRFLLRDSDERLEDLERNPST